MGIFLGSHLNLLISKILNKRVTSKMCQSKINSHQWGKKNYQNLVSGERFQHLLQHLTQLVVNQYIEGNHFHPTSGHEVSVSLGRHSNGTCSSESGTSVLCGEPEGGTDPPRGNPLEGGSPLKEKFNQSTGSIRFLSSTLIPELSSWGSKPRRIFAKYLCSTKIIPLAWEQS